MIKKIGFFILSFIAIIGVGVSFADIIHPNSHREERCVKLQNVEIGEYRAIQTIDHRLVHNCHLADNGDTICDICDGYWDKKYEIKKNKCLEKSKYGSWSFGSCIYLVDKSVDIKDITTDYMKEKAISLGEINPDWHLVENTGFLSDIGNIEVTVYKIEKSDLSGENYYLDEVTTYSIGIGSRDAYTILEFLVVWAITVFIETIVLFFISKFFRKEDGISNGKLFLIGILASTITLPLLWIVLPIFILDYTIYTIVGELLVTVIEIFIIKYGLKVSRLRAILASVICNLCSFLVGLFIF